jgi:tripartite-type tricarboxylate transporter receptor subunit TctC
MADPELREKLDKIGFVVQPPRTAAEITAFVDADRAAWAKVITAQGIALE